MWLSILRDEDLRSISGKRSVGNEQTGTLLTATGRAKPFQETVTKGAEEVWVFVVLRRERHGGLFHSLECEHPFHHFLAAVWTCRV